MTDALASHANTYGIVLAGGLGKRLGHGNKALQVVAGQPLVSHVIDRIKPQLQNGSLWLNANDDATRFASFGLPVLGDTIGGRPGPLAGILVAMQHAPANSWILSVPADTIFVPRNLFAELCKRQRAAGGGIVLAASAGGACHVCGLWPTQLAGDLAEALAKGENKVQLWAARHGACYAEFPLESIGHTRADPFFNINTPGELTEAEIILSAAPS